jgi:hypothetical protein
VESAVKVTRPFETAYVPSLAIVIEVCVHEGAVSNGLTWHSLRDVASRVADPAAVSFERGETDWLSPFCAADSSGLAVGGANVVKETVLLARVPRESAME